MGERGDCVLCQEQDAKGEPVRFKAADAVCFQCGTRVKKILDLHHTRAPLCSLKCEQRYWLDILY